MNLKNNLKQDNVNFFEKVHGVHIPPASFEDEVSNVLFVIYDMLILKNIKYGNSALEPKRIFSKVNSVEQLKVRIDDKLSRISNQNSNEDEDEDVVDDLIGYLVLLKIALKKDK